LLRFKKELQLIQLLRGIACVLVALMHITVSFSQTFHSYFLWNFFKFGGGGVDIFFVLSGFIITYSNRQHIGKPGNILTFVKKRLIRIFPIYWILISFFLVIQLILPAFYATHFQMSLANIFSTYFLLPNHNMLNGVSWSLTNELLFYLLFLLALLIPNKNVVLWLLAVYLIFLILLPAFSFNTLNNHNSFIQLLLFPMNVEFLLGILIVFFVDRFPSKWIFPFLITGLSCFIVSATYYTKLSQAFSGYSRVIMFGFPSFLIILALVKYELITHIKVNNLFLKLGDASYSIYLFHLPIEVAFFKIITKMSVTNHLVLVSLSCGLLAAVCYIGHIIYKKIERPLIKWLNITLS
jgi:exopolysaccharide production protein ExoZ